MLSWIRRMLRLPEPQDTTQHAIEQVEAIETTAQDLRATMLKETRESNQAQHEIRHSMKLHFIEEELLKRIRQEGRENA